jgi:hypothetical protein
LRRGIEGIKKTADSLLQAHIAKQEEMLKSFEIAKASIQRLSSSGAPIVDHEMQTLSLAELDPVGLSTIEQ